MVGWERGVCAMTYEFGWQWRHATRAAKSLAMGMILTMSGFALVIVGTSLFTDRHHPHGAQLFVLAALPLIPILCMLAVVGMYLHAEKDEFQRLLIVRSLLCAIAVALGMNFFAGMLRGLGAIPSWPPFAEFAIFWFVFGAIQLVQVLANRVSDDA
jgi:Kef-type K+ transport system membrane component KefB